MIKSIMTYEMLAFAFMSMGRQFEKAAEQKRNNEPVTACGISEDELAELGEKATYMMNPMMSTEEVKDKLHVSDATLNRMVSRGDIPNGKCKKRGHTRYWKKWDILHFIKSKRGK